MKTYSIRITPYLAEEYEARDLAHTITADDARLGGQHPNPYAKIDGSGVYVFTEAEANELLADADFYGYSIGGPGEYLAPSQRNSYRRLYRQIKNLLQS